MNDKPLSTNYRTSKHLATLAGLVLLVTFGCGGEGAKVAGGEASATPEVEFRLPVHDGSEGPLTFTGASIENGSLVVRLDAAYEGILPLGTPILIVGETETTGRRVLHEDNDIDVIFDGIDLVTGTVVLPEVKLTRRVDIAVRMGDGSFVLPDGVAATFSSTGGPTVGNEARLTYSPVAPTSSSVSLAAISLDGTTVAARGSGGVYEVDGRVRNPSITFPAEAMPLLQNPDAVLTISEVSQLVRYEVRVDNPK